MPKMRWYIIAAAMMAMVQTAAAAEVVALGASNTAGRGIGKHSGGVDTGQAFPAQLESLLHAARCNVTVMNAGRAADTTAMMKDRLSDVVSSDTKVLVLENPKGNDLGAHLTTNAENIAAIKAFAQSHGVTVVPLGNWNAVAGSEHGVDGQHFDAEGHIAMAKYLLPMVKRALNCR
jgi:acyl-CoA thioesterase I